MIVDYINPKNKRETIRVEGVVIVEMLPHINKSILKFYDKTNITIDTSNIKHILA